MLLLDENLSPRICLAIAKDYPGCRHVKGEGMARAADAEVWDYAIKNGLAIVSKDSDFHQRSLVFGPPPKVIWVRLGNSSTDAIVDRLHLHRTEIQEFLRHPETAFFSLL